MYYDRIAAISNEKRNGKGWLWASENRIYGSAGDPPPQGPHANFSPIGTNESVNGIQSFVSNDVYAQCNRMCKLNEGFKYMGKHNLTKMIKNKLYDKHHIGLSLYKYYSNGEIGAQGTAGGNDRANEFNGTYTNNLAGVTPPGPAKKTITFNSDGRNSPFHNYTFNILLGINDCGATGSATSTFPIDITFSASTHFDDCYNLGGDIFNCSDQNISEDADVMDINGEAILATMAERQAACLHITGGENLGSYELLQAVVWGWYDKLYVYRMLQADVALRDSHPDLQAFYTSQAITVVGRMAQFLQDWTDQSDNPCDGVDWVPGLLIQLDNIPEDAPIVTLEKYLYQAQLQVWQQPGHGSFVFDPAVQDEIEVIANMCPAEGGFATFRARRLLEQSNPSLVWDDENICTQSPFLAQKISRATALTIYPNPSQGSFSLQFDKPLAARGRWKLISTDGRMLHNFWVEKGSIGEDIHITNLASGIYYLVNIQGDYATQKIVVNK